MDFYKNFCVVLCLSFTLIVSCIHIQENAYTGVSISFSDHINERDFKYEKLKEVLQKSSEILYHATRKRAYFKEFILTLPSQWAGTGFCAKFTTAPPTKVNIYVSNLPEDLKGQNSKGCGKEGDIIYMPLKWIDGNTEDLAIQFVREWSTFRYGVFEEIPLKKNACYATSDKKWLSVGCYSAKFETRVTQNENGLPSCEPPNENHLTDLKSSLMFKTNYSKALDFCDGSKDFPHNPAMPTLHNNLCDGKTVWSVIQSSADFKNGNFRNLSNKWTVPPSLTLKCYRVPSIHLTLAVQISSTSDITLVVQELRYSLYHFIKNLIPKDSQVNLVTFSDSSHTTKTVTLNLKDDDQLLKTLGDHIATAKEGTNACLICGIEKALNVSQSESHLSPIVVLIAWESALLNQKVSQLVETIQNSPNVQLHLAFIEDTETDVVPIDLVKAVQSSEGFLHSLPKPYRTEIKRPVLNILLFQQLNVILSTVVKNPLEVEDKIIVVHDTIYTNVSSIADTFSIPTVTKGKLIYIIHCDLKDQIDRDLNCSLWDAEYLSTFKCGTVTDLNEISPKVWTYKFDVKERVHSPICSATAILYRQSSSKDNISLRGWLNQYTVTPGKNALIIYAEIIGSYHENIVKVVAQITGPGLDTASEIELRDNGNGDPDIKSGDGIYSRYFTSFKEKGTYVVTVTVKFAQVKNSYIYSSHFEAERIQRKVIASFSLTENMPDIDILPPNRVTDLEVSHIDHVNSTVTLQWTAPGNDYDFGIATEYEIKLATHPAMLEENYFDSDETTTLKAPTRQKSGEKEIFNYSFPRNDQDSIYYVALRARDAQNNRAKISNILQVFLKGTKVIIPEITTVVTVTINGSTTLDINMTFTEDILSSTITTPNDNNITSSYDISWQNVFSNNKFIIILSSAGGILLLLILINIVCCCLMKKKKKPKMVSKKNSLRPPYNMNIAYQHEAQSIISESDLSVSLRNFTDSNQYSTSEGDISPKYAFHTSKSIADKTKSQSNTELGFKLVETLPANSTRSLSRFVRIIGGEAEETSPSIAQPQQPSNNNDTPIMYSLGTV